MSDDLLLTPDEVAKRLKLKNGTIYNMIYEKRIPAVRINRRCVRIRLTDLEAWLGQHFQAPIHDVLEKR